MSTEPEPDLRQDSELRDLILRTLHKHSSVVPVDVTPSAFSPPISRPDIFRIGIQLRDMGFVEQGFARTEHGWAMQISTQGILHAEQHLGGASHET